MREWVENHDEGFPTWVKDLDDRVTSLDHRRLCVWRDEETGDWTWDIEIFHGSGEAAHGTSGSFEAAKRDAEAAADPQ